MKLCEECLGAGYFEDRQEKTKSHCTHCGGDGELPDCSRCGDSMVWDDDERIFHCRCGDEA